MNLEGASLIGVPGVAQRFMAGVFVLHACVYVCMCVYACVCMCVLRVWVCVCRYVPGVT